MLMRLQELCNTCATFIGFPVFYFIVLQMGDPLYLWSTNGYKQVIAQSFNQTVVYLTGVY